MPIPRCPRCQSTSWEECRYKEFISTECDCCGYVTVRLKHEFKLVERKEKYNGQ